MKYFGFIPSVLIIILLPIIGYVTLLWLTDTLAIYDEEGYYYVVLIILLLAIPYVMLKFTFHSINLKNSTEGELNIQDLAKEGQIVRKQHPPSTWWSFWKK